MAEVVSINGRTLGENQLGKAAKKQDNSAEKSAGKPSNAQANYLKLGLAQAGGKLPLFDASGQEIKAATIKSCIEKGWAEPWFSNPIKPNWLVCKLTEAGRKVVS